MILLGDEVMSDRVCKFDQYKQFKFISGQSQFRWICFKFDCVLLQGYALSSSRSGDGCKESVGCSGLNPDALSRCERPHLFTPPQGWPTPPLRQLASPLPLLLDQLQAKNSSHSLRLIWYIQCWYYCRLCSSYVRYRKAVLVLFNK